MGGGQGVASDDGGGVNINIRSSNGSKFSVLVNLASTVGSFKHALSSKCDIPSDQQRLIYKGRILKDDQTLQSYGLEADHAVHLVRGSPPSVAANIAGAHSAGGTNSTQASGFGESVGSGLGASPFSGFPELEQFTAHLTQDPNAMANITNQPAVQSLMNNPDIIRNMIMNNPQMREVIDRNPELGHVLNDPSTLRQTLDAARNPELMREMMRNTDRAMSNIESSPEGFNMLRRMYENIQEPLLNASTMAGIAGDDSSNPFAALLSSQGGNPTGTQSTSPSTVSSDSVTTSSAPNTIPLPNPWSQTGTAGVAQTTTRSDPLGDGRLQTPAGGYGLTFPEFEGMLDSMQDTSLLNQAVQNPAISQLMQSLFSNPQYMNQVLGSDPQLRSMLDSNPQLREMIQNPEFLRQLASPETMQLLLTLQQSLMSRLGLQQQQSTQEPGQNGGGIGSVNSMGLETLMNMFGGLGTGNMAIPNRPNVPPEELYAAQLSQLQDMGFFDRQENIRALMATAGNVHAAIERLLGNSS